MNTSPVRFSFTRCARRHFLESAAAALLALLSFGIAPAALADRDHDQGRDPQHWVASWATSPAAYFVYVAPVPQNQALAPSPTRFTTANIQPDLAFPFPNANTSGANDQTIRSIVKPDLWGNTMRSTTGPGTGERTNDADGFAYEYTTSSWFFLTTLDVMASTDTVVICAFGDSITDGTHTTFNGNDRWANVLSRRLHDAYGNKVSIVNEAIGGNRVINPVVANATSGPAAVDRLDRDVLGLSGLTDVIWLEGINDLGAGYGAAANPVEDPVIHTPQAIIAGYQDVVARLHREGVKVYGATVVSALGLNNPAQGWDLIHFPSFLATVDNGAAVEAGRLILNQFIRTPGNFDGVVDFDAATRDPDPAALGNMKAKYLPNSQFTQLPLDYLHPNHAGYNAMGLAVDIAPFAPAHHRSRRGD